MAVLNCPKIDCVLPRHAHVESVTFVQNGTSYGEGRIRNPAYPTNPTNLPELCAVIVNDTTSPSSSYRFGIFLPTQWNNRFLAVGNGGFAGGINWLDMGAGVHYGFAVMSTDTGHNSTSGDLNWALGEAEKQKDFGFRAMHGAVVLSKLLIHIYYNDDLGHSYYSGCSTGGRQGLKELQLYPDSFDGALVGAPAWWSPNLATWTTKVGTYNLPVNASHHIPAAGVSILGKEVRRQCDGVDGVVDGIISAPQRCDFDFTQILCGRPGVDVIACLTTEQLKTAESVYGDYTIDGKFVFPGLSLGSEDLWGVLLGQGVPDARGQEYVKMFLLGNKDWDWRTYNDSIATLATTTDPGDLAADVFNVSAFRDRGGKLIMYHGDADGLIPTQSSDYFYSQVAAVMGGTQSLASWFRYFHVPGLGHCGGTRVDAPWYFAGGSQAGTLGTGVYSVPGFVDAKHDALLALVDWVEKGVPVDSIIATTWNEASNPASGVLRQRPLCPFPQQATLLTSGESAAVAKSWHCG
ncbi:feruloyl esterase B [Lasiosphaeria hispida]|uniref:Carboxylic ester hydrolase n=1 Tax=Lasiosphaeria hispida TaxID=260671 RepID=A0AAJ0MFA2_9PEZI|nr:feruloyl esterase B [Lasiosphaeria hispida]